MRGGLYDVGGGGALHAGAAQDGGLTGGDHGADGGVLVRLGLSQIQSLYLPAQSGDGFIFPSHLHGVQLGDHPVGVVVDVLGRLVHLLGDRLPGMEQPVEIADTAILANPTTPVTVRCICLNLFSTAPLAMAIAIWRLS